MNKELGLKNLYDAREMYSTNSSIKFKTTELISNLCDYSDEGILLNGLTAGRGDTVAERVANERGKEVK